MTIAILESSVDTCANQWPLNRYLYTGIKVVLFRNWCFTLATGRQPGTFSEISYGISYLKFWVLKGGNRGGCGGAPLHPPFKIQISVMISHLI